MANLTTQHPSKVYLSNKPLDKFLPGKNKVQMRIECNLELSVSTVLFSQGLGTLVK